MIETVFGWQIFIVATLLVAKFVSLGALMLVAVIWAIWTVAVLSSGPLILLQLCVIGTATGLFLKERSSPPKPVVNTSTQNPSVVARPDVRKPAGPSILQNFLASVEKLEKATQVYRDETIFWLEFEKQFIEQKALVRAMLKRAEESAELERKLNQSPGYREIFESCLREPQEGDSVDPSSDRVEIKPLPRAPREIEWPVDPERRRLINESLTEHLNILTGANARIEEVKYVRAAVGKHCPPDFLPWLRQEIDVLRELLNSGNLQGLAQLAATPLLHGQPSRRQVQTPTMQTPQTNEALFHRDLEIRVGAQSFYGAETRVATPLNNGQKQPLPDWLEPFLQKGKAHQKPHRQSQPGVVSKGGFEEYPVVPLTSEHHGKQFAKTEQEALRKIVQDRAIPHLTHFTRGENLQSILRAGLLSRTEAHLTGTKIPGNDSLRLDRRPDRVSTSITFPNYSMFYKYRQEELDGDWVVILLKRDILWELDCLFTPHNAADHRVVAMREPELTGASALERLFSSEDRADSLRPCDPTDPQAEVMVKSRIGPEWIDAIAFETDHALRRHSRYAAAYDVFSCGPNSGLFASRFDMLKSIR